MSSPYTHVEDDPAFWHDPKHDSGEVRAIQHQRDLKHLLDMSRSELVSMSDDEFDGYLRSFGPQPEPVAEVAPMMHTYLIQLPVNAVPDEDEFPDLWLDEDERVIGWLIQRDDGHRRMVVPAVE